MKKPRMKIPKSVNVLGHDYTVQFVKELALGGTHRGECIYPDRVINIHHDLKHSPEFAWSYFLHELRHAFQFEHGTMQVLDQQATELDADSFASFISSLQKQGVL